MMRTLGIAGVVLLALFTSACRFEIRMPETGGSVISERFRCEPGDTCLVEVDDATFDETFTVELAPGYEFAGWLKAAGHYCGDSREDCRIASTALVGDLATLLDADITLFLAPQFICAPDDLGQRPDTCSGDVTKTISGQVTDAPVANANITVTVGAETFTTQADELGFYSLDVSTSDLDALVRVSATGTSQTGQALEFLSLAGAFENLDAESVQDVTNVTTAAALLAAAANGGQEPATPEELQAAETAVDAETLLELAAVIKLLVDDADYSLPDGTESLLAFAGDSAAVEDFIAAVEASEDGSALQRTIEEILDDASLLPGFTASQLPARFFELPTAAPGYLARTGAILEFDEEGDGGRILSYDANTGVSETRPFTWHIASGQLVLVYLDPLTSSSFIFPDETIATIEQLDLIHQTPSRQVLEITTIERSVYTLVTDGVLVDLVQVEEEQQISYEPVTVNGETVQLAARSETDGSTVGLRSENALESVPFVSVCGGNNAAVCVPGTWGASMRYAPGGQFPLSDWGEVVSFSDTGVASGEISGVVAEWSVIAGKLVISYSDGWTQTVTIVDQLGVEYGVFKEYSNGSERFADYSIYVKADPQLVFTEDFLDNAEGEYWSGELTSWIPGVLDATGDRIPSSIFGWSFSMADDPMRGFNERARGRGDSLTLDQVPVTWSLDDNVLNIDRGFSSLRNWYPLVETVFRGDRQIYVMELEQGFGGVAIPARLNIERERPRRTDFDNDPIEL